MFIAQYWNIGVEPSGLTSVLSKTTYFEIM